MPTVASTSDSGVLSYTTDGDEKILQKDVIFYPTVDGKNVYGIFRTTVGIGEGGKTVYFSKQSFEPKAGGEVKLKSIDEVKQSISKGEFISNAAGASGTATITDYELCYYCDGVVKDGKLYVQPVYVFSAEIDNNTGEAEHFEVFVDAASHRSHNKLHLPISYRYRGFFAPLQAIIAKLKLERKQIQNFTQS